MLLEELPVAVSEFLHEPCRALDVREQEGDGAGRDLSCPILRESRRRRSRRERLVLLQDRPLQSPELLARLEPEFLVEATAAGPIDVQGFGLAPAAIEREHQLTAETLAERVLADEALQLRDELRVTPELQICRDPQLERRQPLLAEPCPLGARERPVELG